jgi:heme oxygenase
MENSVSVLEKDAQGADSSALRNQTASAHRAVEHTLNLPEAIKDFEDYRRWLTRFFGIYYSIEESLGRFTQWDESGIPFEPFARANSLSKDLNAMSVPIETVELAPRDQVPQFVNFSEAVGALYVLEGSTLGGRFILLDLSKRLGQRIDGANSFFAGYGSHTGLSWTAFKTSLDNFLSQDPVRFSSVLTGANATFASVESWMSFLTGRGKP